MKSPVPLSIVCVGLLMGCSPPASYNAATVSQPSVAAVAIQPTAIDPSDRWSVDNSSNLLDGKKSVTVSTSKVVLRCSPKFEGYIIPTIDSLGNSLDESSDRDQVVRYRIDDGPVRRQTWDVSKDMTALFPPPSTVRQFLKAKKVIVEYKPSYVVPQTETFDVTGLREAALKAGCKV